MTFKSKPRAAELAYVPLFAYLINTPAFGLLADTSWPVTYQDVQHTDRRPCPGPGQPSVRWAFSANGLMQPSAAISNDGTFDVGSKDNKLHATGHATGEDPGDLTIGWMRRLPEVDYVWGSTNPTAEGWPAAGLRVNWQAHVKNWSEFDRPGVLYKWYLDAVEVSSDIVDLPARSIATIEYPWTWTFDRHELELVIDPANSVPDENRLTTKDLSGNLLANADIKIHRAVAQPGVWYGKHYDDIPDTELTTDANGQVLLGRVPFDGDGRIDHGYSLANGTIILRVEHEKRVGYAFLEATQFNIEYWRGHTSIGDYEVRVRLIETPTAISTEESQTTPWGACGSLGWKGLAKPACAWRCIFLQAGCKQLAADHKDVADSIEHMAQDGRAATQKTKNLQRIETPNRFCFSSGFPI